MTRRFEAERYFDADDQVVVFVQISGTGNLRHESARRQPENQPDRSDVAARCAQA